jgi:hypothetical protein
MFGIRVLLVFAYNSLHDIDIYLTYIIQSFISYFIV